MIFCLGALVLLFLLAAFDIPILRNHLLKISSVFFLICTGWFFMNPEGLFQIPVFSQVGVFFSLQLNGLSWAFALLIFAISVFVFWYADAYMRNSPYLRRFQSAFILFAFAMLGLVFSDNIFIFFLFWELTSLTSYLLISLKNKEEANRAASHQVFLVTLFGGFFLLAGLLWMQKVGLSAGLSLKEASHFSSLLSLSWIDFKEAPWIFLLLLVGAGSKSAQLPFHFWLPQAMAAPTPVSSYLHSATMVKAGIFLLAKIFPAFHELPIWTMVLVPLGLGTALWTAILCLLSSDLKRILAWSTVSVLGILTMLLGLQTELALKSFVVFLFAHAFYKASLFQVAGNIDYATGSRNIDQLSGLYKFMSLTAVAGGLAALSKAGAPPFFGFIGKELILKTKLNLESYELLFLVCAFAINLLLMVSALLVGIKPFFGKKRADLPKMQLKKLPIGMQMAPLFLAFVGPLFGIFPSLFDNTVGPAMVSAVSGASLSMDLKLWHGLNPTALIALGISLVTFVVGLLLFSRFNQWKQNYRLVVDRVVDSRKVLDKILAILQKGFQDFVDWQSNRPIAIYLFVFIAVFFSSFYFVSFDSGVHLLSFFKWTSVLKLQDLSLGLASVMVILLLIALAASVSVLFVKPFILCAIILGIVGAILAFLFGSFGAPDLAMTQILAELLIAVLIASFAYKLKDLPSIKEERFHLVRFAFASLFAFFIFLLSQNQFTQSAVFDSRDFYLRNALDQAKGQNVVNVILVDFRALDTLNEVLVVLLAAIGVGILFYRSRSSESGVDSTEGLK